MMSRTLQAVLLSILCFAQLSTIIASGHEELTAVPFLLFSNQRYSQNQRAIQNVLDISDTQKILESILHPSAAERSEHDFTLHKADSGASSPDILIGIIQENTLTSTDFLRQTRKCRASSQDSFLCGILNAVESSESGIVVPYVRAPSSAAAASLSSEFSAATDGKGMLHSFRFRHSECPDSSSGIREIIQRQSNAGKAPAAEFLEFRISGGIWKNECFEQILSELKGSERNFGVFLTSENNNDPSSSSSSSSRENRISNAVALEAFLEEEVSMELFKFSLLNDTDPKYPTGPTMITPNILLGLLYGGFLIFMLLCAVACVCKIETPPQFAKASLVISKEY